MGWSETWFNIGHGDLTVYFRGQKIVEGVVATLLAPEFGLATAARVLFGGCSEGGRGAMANIDYLTGKEPAGLSQVMFPSSADVRGFFDGAMQLDIDVYDTAVAAVSMQNQTAEALVFLNATGRMGSSCNLAFGDTAVAYRCLYGMYRLNFLSSKYLAAFSQFDTTQLTLAEGGGPPYVGPQLVYADKFQNEMRYQALQFPNAQQSGSAIFASACSYHCNSNTGAFWGIKVPQDGGEASLASFAGAWYFGGSTPFTKQLAKQAQCIESCSGYGCGQCGGAPSAIPNPPLPPARMGLRAPIMPSPSPPLGALALALGETPAKVAARQQAAQHNEQALASTTSSGHTMLQVHVFHFFLFLLACFALLAARLACRAARPSEKRAAAEAAAGGGGGGGASATLASELTPLVGGTRQGGPYGGGPKPVRAPPAGAKAGYSKVTPLSES